MALVDEKLELTEEPEPSPDQAGSEEPSGQPVAQREFESGLEHQRANRLDEAIRAYVRAVEIDPGHGRALNNLGVALRARGLHHAALAAYQRALALNPDNPGLLGNKGNVLRAMGRQEEALQCLHAAVQQAPEAAGLHQNLGLVLRDLGHFREALGCFERSLALRPDHPATQRDRAHALLASGDYLQGFKALAACADAEEATDRFERVARWHGESLSGGTILVHAGRDLASTIQFARLLPRLKAEGGRVLFECPRALHGLLAAIEGIDQLLDSGAEVWGIDRHVPLLALPAVFRINTLRVPASTPYLAAPRAAGFELRHPASARLAVGIAWHEGDTAPVNPAANVGLEPFFALFERPDVAIYSLQRGPAAGELRRLGAAGLVLDLSNLLIDLDDIARVIEQLDLVVCTDTLVAHLAGALGKPVWLVLPEVCDWRWQLEADSSPWYPTMRLFRRERSGSWERTFAQVAGRLGELVDRTAS